MYKGKYSACVLEGIRKYSGFSLLLHLEPPGFFLQENIHELLTGKIHHSIRELSQGINQW